MNIATKTYSTSLARGLLQLAIAAVLFTATARVLYAAALTAGSSPHGKTYAE